MDLCGEDLGIWKGWGESKEKDKMCSEVKVTLSRETDSSTYRCHLFWKTRPGPELQTLSSGNPRLQTPIRSGSREQATSRRFPVL